MQQPLFWKSLTDEDLADALRQAGYDLDKLLVSDQKTLLDNIRRAIRAHKTVLVITAVVVDVVMLDD